MEGPIRVTSPGKQKLHRGAWRCAEMHGGVRRCTEVCRRVRKGAQRCAEVHGGARRCAEGCARWCTSHEGPGRQKSRSRRVRTGAWKLEIGKIGVVGT